MNKPFIALLFLLFLSSFVISQDFDHYQPIKARGPIPVDFLGSSTEKFEASLKTIEHNTDSRERQVKERFYLESNFNIDEMLLSGRVLFNDPISNYLNRVADEILKDDPELRQKLRFYVLKSPIPNAFTTNQGIIFVNMGLFPRLENEAQLAFILCHEMAHFVEQHVIEGYVREAEIDLRDEQYQNSSAYEKLMLKNLYSQDHEMEADIKGFALFAKTDYSAETIPNVFDILKNADIPHISPKAPEALFHTKDLQLDDFDKHLAKINEEGSKTEEDLDLDDIKNPHTFSFKISPENQQINTNPRAYSKRKKNPKKEEPKPTEQEEVKREEEKIKEEDLLTHPSPEMRREAILAELIKLQPQGEAIALVSTEIFEKVKKIANYELCEIFLQTTSFHDALHHAMALKDLYPQSSYLDFSIVKALYGKAKHRIENEDHDNYMSYDELEKKIAYFYKYGNRINRKKYATMALSHSWNYFISDTTNKHAQEIVEDLVVDLLGFYPNLESTKSRRNDTAIVAFFAKLKARKAFTPLLDRCLKERKRLDDYEAYKSSAEGEKEIAKWRKQKRRKGYTLGIDTVVIFAPLYFHIDLREKKGTRIQYLSAEQQQKKMRGYILNNAKMLGLEVVLLDAKSLKADQTEIFNDISVAYAWYDEWTRSEVKMIPSNYLEMQRLSKKYGTPYFAHMGGLLATQRSIFHTSPEGVITTSIILFPALPYLLYLGFRPQQESLSYTLLFDVEKNRPQMVYRNHSEKKLEGSKLYNEVQFMLHQIKRKQLK